MLKSDSQRTRGVRSVGVVVLLAAIALAACGGASSSKASNSASTKKGDTSPIKIGLVGPLSGPYAVSTISIQGSLKAWQEVTNQNGGILGRKVQITSTDDQADPAKSVQAVRSLVEGGTTIIVGPVVNAPALQPLSAQGVDFINYTILPFPQLNDGKAFPYTFNHYPPDVEGVEYIGDTLKKADKLKWALLYDTSQTQSSAGQLVKAEAPKVGADITLEKTFDPNTTDFGPIVQQVQSSGANAILLYTIGPNVGRFMQAIGAASVKTPIYGNASLSSSDLTVAPPEVLKQVSIANIKSGVFPSGISKPPSGMIPFLNQLYKDIGKDKVIGGALPVTFDMFQQIKFAIEKAGSTDPAKMRKVMNTEITNKSFLTPDLKWNYTTENHGGYPTNVQDGFALASPVTSTEWPGYAQPAGN